MLRKKALLACLGFLNRQNYYLAQDNVMLINEPLLVGDIIFNKALYFCGYKEYSDAIALISDWDNFALARANTPRAITDEFTERFPAITIRGKHTILALGQKYSYDRSKFSDWLFSRRRTRREIPPLALAHKTASSEAAFLRQNIAVA